MARSHSPITVDTARRISAYNSAVFGRYVRSARRLTWRDAIKDRGSGHRSIFQTLVHVLNVHEVWMIYICQGRGGELESLFQTTSRRPQNWGEFNKYARQVSAGIVACMAALTPVNLGQRVRAPWMPGTYTVGDAILQTTFEQAHHLGEIIGIYWTRGKAPPEMTWIDVNRVRLR